jgi:hypothetical protein
MFLYARLVLDYLTKNIFFTGKEMKASIDELPEELTELYVAQSFVCHQLTRSSATGKSLHKFSFS